MAAKLLMCMCAASLSSLAHGFGSGAPDSACLNMIPQHPVDPQRSAPPYTVTTSTKVAKAGQPIEVVIKGKSADNTIKGFMLQAREGDQILKGTFKIPPGDLIAQQLNCGAPANTLTHKKHSQDPNAIAYTWTPPAGYVGQVKFRSTVALNGGVFWVGVESAPVKISQ